jgi:hypothetical protein
MSDTGEQRQFSRIAFDAPVSVSQQESSWQTRVVDLSLKGVLLEDSNCNFAHASPAHITITLDAETAISMQGHWVHSEAGRSGFKCDHIDLESITHLRRLVELNLGNEELLERELSHLG